MDSGTLGQAARVTWCMCVRMWTSLRAPLRLGSQPKLYWGHNQRCTAHKIAMIVTRHQLDPQKQTTAIVHARVETHTHKYAQDTTNKHTIASCRSQPNLHPGASLRSDRLAWQEVKSTVPARRGPEMRELGRGVSASSASGHPPRRFSDLR